MCKIYNILQLRDREYVCMGRMYMIPKLVQGVKDCPMGIDQLVRFLIWPVTWA